MEQQHLERLTKTQLIERIIELQTRLEERGRWPQTITRSKQLLVEGQDDFAFFLALLEKMDVHDVQIQVYRGKKNLSGFLSTLTKLSGFEEKVTSIGVVRDANSDPQNTFYSIQNALRKAGLPVPNQPQIPMDNGKHVNVLILPDADSTGELETLMLRAVDNDPVMPCINRYFECVEKQIASLPNNMNKARLQAFLASKHNPSLRSGEAAHRSYLNLDSPIYDHVKRFIQSL